MLFYTPYLHLFIHHFHTCIQNLPNSKLNLQFWAILRYLLVCCQTCCLNLQRTYLKMWYFNIGQDQRTLNILHCCEINLQTRKISFNPFLIWKPKIYWSPPPFPHFFFLLQSIKAIQKRSCLIKNTQYFVKIYK